MHPSTHSAVPTEFLRRRVAIFGLVAGGLGAIMWTYRAVLLGASGGGSRVLEPSMTTHLFASVALLLVWVLNGFGQRSRVFVETTEFVGLVAGLVGYELMATTIPPSIRPDLIAVLALTFTLMARAVYVPSTGVRTALMSAAAFAPLAGIVYVGFRDFDTSSVSQLTTTTSAADAEWMAFYVALTTGVWGLMVTLLATGTSHVIYGLRREVHRAERLGQYVLEQELGSGGMGVVYRARHALLKRPTAIKLLSPDRSGARGSARFEHEVRQTARLTHPSTITIYDYGHTPDGLFYYAMEYLEGADLQQLVEADGAQPEARVLRVMHQVAGALGEAHRAGLIHRDVKPSNVILCERGGEPDIAKVVDFGLVKDVSAEAAHLSTTGSVTGTPAYMAPEAVHDPDGVDGRIDVYGLGAVGYFLVTGQDVFSGANVLEVIGHHLHTQPEPPSRRLERQLPDDFERLLLRCLAKRADARPQDMTALREAIEACDAWNRWEEAAARAWWAEVGPELHKLRDRGRGRRVSRALPVRALSPTP